MADCPVGRVDVPDGREPIPLVGASAGVDLASAVHDLCGDDGLALDSHARLSPARQTGWSTADNAVRILALGARYRASIRTTESPGVGCARASPVQDSTYRALGALPVEASFTFPELVRTGALRAVETDVAPYAHNGYCRLLAALAGNVVLWPRMPVITMSRIRYDGLTGRQRE